MGRTCPLCQHQHVSVLTNRHFPSEDLQDRDVKPDDLGVSPTRFLGQSLATWG